MIDLFAGCGGLEEVTWDGHYCEKTEKRWAFAETDN